MNCGHHHHSIAGGFHYRDSIERMEAAMNLQESMSVIHRTIGLDTNSLKAVEMALWMMRGVVPAGSRGDDDPVLVPFGGLDCLIDAAQQYVKLASAVKVMFDFADGVTEGGCDK